jgi:hypothetical protein
MGVFVDVVSNVPMLVTGVTDNVMVVFIFVVSDVLMLVTGMTGSVMVLFVFVVGDVVMVFTGVTAVPWWCLPSCSSTCQRGER